MTPVLDKLLVICRRDLLIWLRHGRVASLEAISILVEIAGFYFLSRAIGPNFRPDGIAYFPFLLVGTGFFGLLLGGASAFVSAVQEAQLTGTMEVRMTTATPPAVIVLLSALSAFAGRSLHTFLTIAAGILLFRVSIHHPNLPAILVISSLSISVAIAIGIVAAAVQLSFQRGNAVMWLVGTSVGFLSGTMFPVGALPAPLQRISALLPITYTLNGIRQALFLGKPISALGGSIAGLGLSLLVLIPFSLFVFSCALRKARLEGTLSFY
jgi:ABC-2 type transport system permease protein